MVANTYNYSTWESQVGKPSGPHVVSSWAVSEALSQKNPNKQINKSNDSPFPSFPTPQAQPAFYCLLPVRMDSIILSTFYLSFFSSDWVVSVGLMSSRLSKSAFPSFRKPSSISLWVCMWTLMFIAAYSWEGKAETVKGPWLMKWPWGQSTKKQLSWKMR